MKKSRAAMPRLIPALVVLAAIVASADGCRFYNITTDYERETDFESYRTFSVSRALPIDTSGSLPAVLDPEIVDRRALFEIRRVLVERGFQESPASEADFLVRYHLSARQAVRASSQPGHVRWLREDVREIHYGEYTEGTLVIDIIDRGQSLLVWHGAARAGIKPDRVGSGSGRGDLEIAIARLLKRFPPRVR